MQLATAIISILNELFTLGYKIAALRREAKAKGWIKDGRSLSAIIEEAKTDEERSAIARRLFEHSN